MKIDATYFDEGDCVLVYKSGATILFWHFAEREYFDVYYEGLQRLIKRGYSIQGVTSDWHGSLVAAVQSALPSIPHQRCIIHTERLCKSLITRRPKTEAGRMLLRIVRQMKNIKSTYDVVIWSKWIKLWKKRHETLIQERTQGTKDDGTQTWWYTHKYLRRAFRTVWSTQSHLFLYLEHPGLDKDTNGLEGEFSHLKGKLGAHRGLHKSKRHSYVSWYLFFKK